MAKLYSAAQLALLRNKSKGSKKLKSALEIAQKGGNLTNAQKNMLKKALAGDDFLSRVEIKKQKTAADLPKPRATEQPKSKSQPKSKPKPKGIKENFRAGKEAADKTIKNAKQKIATNTQKAADATARVAGRTTAKTANAVSKGLQAGAKGLGAAAKVGSKAFLPLAIASEVYDGVKAASSEEGMQEVQDRAMDMAENDGALMRAAKGALSPTATIMGSYGALTDALEGDIRERARAKELDATVEERKAKAVSGIEAKRRENAARLAAQAEAAEDEKPEISEEDAKFLDRLDQRVLRQLRNEPLEEEPVAEDSDYDPTKHDMYGSGLNDDYDPTKNEMYGTQPEEAEEAVDYTDEAVSLFKNTHGTEFDPKSSMDKKKLGKMKDLLAKQGGLGKMSPNQFALQVYRNS